MTNPRASILKAYGRQIHKVNTVLLHIIRSFVFVSMRSLKVATHWVGSAMHFKNCIVIIHVRDNCTSIHSHTYTYVLSVVNCVDMDYTCILLKWPKCQYAIPKIVHALSAWVPECVYGNLINFFLIWKLQLTHKTQLSIFLWKMVQFDLVWENLRIMKNLTAKRIAVKHSLLTNWQCTTNFWPVHNIF